MSVAMGQADVMRHSLDSAAVRGLAQDCGLPGWMAEGARLWSFDPRGDWPGAMDIWEQCTLYAGNVHPMAGAELLPIKRNWLVLCGNYGTGKSHLAAGIVFDVALAGGCAARFIPWVEHLDALRDSFSDVRTPSGPLMDALLKPYLVAIDDLDKEPGTDWSKKILFQYPQADRDG